jgi:hypothetical protein
VSLGTKHYPLGSSSDSRKENKKPPSSSREVLGGLLLYCLNQSHDLQHLFVGGAFEEIKSAAFCFFSISIRLFQAVQFIYGRDTLRFENGGYEKSTQMAELP